MSRALRGVARGNNHLGCGDASDDAQPQPAHLPVDGPRRRSRRREAHGELRHHVVRDAWTVAKRFAAESVQNIERREVPVFVDAVIEGYVEDHQGC